MCRITIFRPSIVLGDSRYRKPRSSIWCGHLCFSRLAGAAVRPDDKIDIVPVDFVADAIAALHQKHKPQLTPIISRRAVLADISGIDQRHLQRGRQARSGVPAGLGKAIRRVSRQAFANRKGSMATAPR